jgi:Polysaccharide lyase
MNNLETRRHGSTGAAPRATRLLTLILTAAAVLLAWRVAVSPAQDVKPPTPGEVYDGFEAAELGPVWDTSKFEPGAVTIQSDVVRVGQRAARVVLRPGDFYEPGSNGDPATERAELMESRTLISKEGTPYEYTFSIFVPKDFPIVPVRLVIAQWKQYCPGKAPCSDDSPVLAVRYIGGQLRITQALGPDRRTQLYRAAHDLRGKWSDFKFNVRFAPDETGRVEAWLGDTRIVDYRGTTAYAEGPASGYPTPSVFYFKMGLYRDVMAEPMTLYFDEYRKRELAAGALP